MIDLFFFEVNHQVTNLRTISEAFRITESSDMYQSLNKFNKIKLSIQGTQQKKNLDNR